MYPLASRALEYQKTLRELIRVLSFSVKLDVVKQFDHDEQNKDTMLVLNFGSGNT